MGKQTPKQVRGDGLRCGGSCVEVTVCTVVLAATWGIEVAVCVVVPVCVRDASLRCVA